MTHSPPAKPAKPETDMFAEAFEALTKYREGSGRAALLPLDQAVGGATGSERRRLEERLLAVLRAGPSPVASEYICSKLVLIGSAASVPALAALLADPQVATAARTALEAMPSHIAARALRNSLPKLENAQRIGAINSLAVRRDEESVAALSDLLPSRDEQLALAAAAALGCIGTEKASKALRVFWQKAPAGIQIRLADALLVCAEQLLAAKKPVDAKALYELVTAPTLPHHIQTAARKGLAIC